jgi:ABC-type transport system involved in multi-copper enzyme maturation permease subunit
VRYVLVELRRYASRRAVRASGALVLLGIAIASVIVFVNSNSGPDASFDQGFHLADLTDIYSGLALLLMILSLGLGASFIGAEWGAGTITTYLTWEPRRVRAFIAKTAGAVVFIFVAALVVQALLGFALTPAGALRGTTEGIDGGWVVDTAIMMLRSATLSAIFAGVGFALASAARNTAASIIVGFVYFAVLEPILRAFRPNWARWLVGENAALWLVGDEAGVGFSQSRLRALVTLVAYALILLSVSLALFRRRDVT